MVSGIFLETYTWPNWLLYYICDSSFSSSIKATHLHCIGQRSLRMSPFVWHYVTVTLEKWHYTLHNTYVLFNHDYFLFCASFYNHVEIFAHYQLFKNQDHTIIFCLFCRVVHILQFLKKGPCVKNNFIQIFFSKEGENCYVGWYIRSMNEKFLHEICSLKNHGKNCHKRGSICT